MSGSINDLIDAQHGGSVLSSIAHPMVANPLAAIMAGNAAAASDVELMQRKQQLDQSTYNLHLQRMGQLQASFGKLMQDHPDGNIPAVETHAAIDRDLASGLIPPQVAQQAHSAVSDDPAKNFAIVSQGFNHIMTVQQQYQRVFGTQELIPLSGGPQIRQVPPPTPGAAPINIPQTLAPDWLQTTVTKEDPRLTLPDGTRNPDYGKQKTFTRQQELEWTGTTIGPNGEVYHGQPGGGGGSIPGNGRYPTLPPAALPATPAAGSPAAPTPAPTVSPPAADPGRSGPGFGAAVPGSTAPPTVAPTPPATVQPAPPIPFDAANAAVTQAKVTRKPVAVPNGNGLTAMPDGRLTPSPPPGTTPLAAPAAPVAAPPPAVPPNAPRASLAGGVPVASANMLQVPTATGTPSAPSALVPGDVAAMMQGVQRARASPMAGTMVAGSPQAGWGTAPGTYGAPAPPSAVRPVAPPAAASPAVPSIWDRPVTGLSEADKELIRQSGPGFVNEASAATEAQQQRAILDNMLGSTKMFMPGAYAETMKTWRNRLAPLFGVNETALAGADDFDKLAAQLASAQGKRSDANLSVATAANPHPGQSAAGVDFVIRQLQGNSDYLQARAKLATDYQPKTDYTGFQGSLRELDPRVFQYERLTDQQRRDYVTAMEPKDRQAFIASHGFAERKGLVPAR